MQNRFGLKDFITLLLLAVIGVSLWVAMFQRNREWDQGQLMLDKLSSLESQISGLRSSVEAMPARPVERPDTAPAASSASSTPTAPTPASSAGGDDSWARPGVAIVRHDMPQPSHDPQKSKGFRVGGEITEIWEAQTKTLTPNISTDVYSRRVQELVLESLGDYDPETLKMRGVLAEAWQVDPDGKWLRARLRPGLRFSDGQPLTAEDVRYSFHDYLMNEQIEAERSRSIYRDSIEKVEVLDARTVEFTFKERLFSNVTNALGMFVMPAHIYSKLTPAQINRSTGLLVGSGPFRMRNFDVDAQWAPPDDIVLERNEQYWGAKPAVATLRYRAINEEIGRLNSYFAGQAEIVTPSAPQFVSKQEDPEWQARTQFLKWVNMRSGYNFIAWNCGERNGKLTPFANPKVRRAMTHALDREKMIRDIYKGIGEVAKGNQPIASAGSNKDIKPWPYDRAAALTLLKEAGWDDRNGDGTLEDSLGNPFRFEFTYSGGSEIADRVAKFVKDAYGAIGIEAVLKPVEWAVYTDLLKTRDFDAITLGWGANAPESDPIQIFHSKSIQNQGDNFAQWNNPKADELIDAGRREMDDDKRAAIWRQLETVLHEEGPYTFMRVPPWLRFVSSDVGNIVMYPKGLEPAEYFRAADSTPNPGL